LLQDSARREGLRAIKYPYLRIYSRVEGDVEGRRGEEEVEGERGEEEVEGERGEEEVKGERGEEEVEGEGKELHTNVIQAQESSRKDVSTQWVLAVYPPEGKED
jgi:hypothetical protein